MIKSHVLFFSGPVVSISRLEFTFYLTNLLSFHLIQVTCQAIRILTFKTNSFSIIIICSCALSVRNFDKQVTDVQCRVLQGHLPLHPRSGSGGGAYILS